MFCLIWTVLGLPDDVRAAVAAADPCASTDSTHNNVKITKIPVAHNNVFGRFFTDVDHYCVRMPILLSRMA